MKNFRRIMAGMIWCAGIGMIFIGKGASAQTKPQLNISESNLKISIISGVNEYEKQPIKVVNKSDLIIKKIKYKSGDCNTAAVSDNGEITAQKAGKTTITIKIKYKNKKKDDWKTDTEKIDVTVENEWKEEIPETDIQYDENGAAKPIYPFTVINDNEGLYSNAASYIQRFPVYVETDYDTDQDGKRDLVMAFVQIPKSAVDGYYKAPALMVTDPYLAYGTNTKYPRKFDKNAFDYNSLLNSPDPRKPACEVTTVQAAAAADEWVERMGDTFSLIHLEEYEYYLARGYAVVVSAGPGGSAEDEGLQLCGEKIEAEDYAAIIEWLHGDRTAYADKAGTKQIRADWCNGHSAVTGFSYGGTLAYEVATTGVKGLDTAIPKGAIASWYDYVYMQGSLYIEPQNYMTFLRFNCAKRYTNDIVTYDNKINLKKHPDLAPFYNYMFRLNYDAFKASGVFGEFWNRFAFHKGGNIRVPGLVVEGLNDVNVQNKQTVLMREAFKKAGQDVKLVLHQGAHEDMTEAGYVASVNGEYYDELINRWLSHYVGGVNNGIETMKDFTVQSNVDGTWETFDGDRELGSCRIDPSGGKKQSTLKFDGIIRSYPMTGPTAKQLKEDTLVWEKEITEDTKLCGNGEVHLRLKIPNVKKNNLILGVYLFDECNKKFNAYAYDPDYPNGSIKTEILFDKIIDQGNGLYKKFEYFFKQEPTKGKKITQGRINLFMPDAGWEPESCVMPENKIKKNTWYDYTVILQPNYYTVKKGHKLRLYIVTANQMEILMGQLTDRYVKKMTSDYLIPTEYSFTIDNKNSYATIPTFTE